MAEPTLVPPTPTINQGDSPEVVAETLKNVQSIFDKVAPAIKGEPTPPAPVAPPVEPAKPPPEAPVVQEPPSQAPPPEAPPAAPEPQKLPSFIEEALRVGEPVSAPAPAEEMFPEAPPEFRTPEERTQRYKAWREEFNRMKAENKELRARPAMDESTSQRLMMLETQNKEMSAALDRAGVE